MRIAALPEGADPGVHPAVLATGNDDAHRFAEVEPASTAWIPFGGTAVALLLLAGLSVVLAARPFGVAVFGQRDPATQPFGWLPGHGSHGGAGGQVPPYVPYVEDWDPRNRIQ